MTITSVHLRYPILLIWIGNSFNKKYEHYKWTIWEDLKVTGMLLKQTGYTKMRMGQQN